MSSNLLRRRDISKYACRWLRCRIRPWRWERHRVESPPGNGPGRPSAVLGAGPTRGGERVSYLRLRLPSWPWRWSRSRASEGRDAASSDGSSSPEYVEGAATSKALDDLQRHARAPSSSTACPTSAECTGTGAFGGTLRVPRSPARSSRATSSSSRLQASTRAAPPATDQTNGAGWFNGDDAVALRKRHDRGRSIGQRRLRPRARQWRTGLDEHGATTLSRAPQVRRSEAGDTNRHRCRSTPARRLWGGFAVDTFDGLGTRHG